MEDVRTPKNYGWVWWGLAAAIGVSLLWRAVDSVISFDFSVCGVKDIRRVPSPKGDHELLIQELDCGATVDSIYEFFVVKSGESPDDQDMFLKLDHGSPD